MKIFDHNPDNWRELQDLVSQAFKQMGCETYVEHQLKTARGVSNIDVYVRDTSSVPASTYICECKFWSRKVPKEIIHQVRSIVSNAGVNYGLIISKNGFQKGAYESCRNTNIQLLTWVKFQKLFFDRWFNSLLKTFERPITALFYYLDPSNEEIYKLFDWSFEDLEEYDRLRDKHRWLMEWFLHTNNGVPISTFFKMEQTIYSTYREFINTIVEMAGVASNDLGSFYKRRKVSIKF